jgi:hypothetical protein
MAEKLCNALEGEQRAQDHVAMGVESVGRTYGPNGSPRPADLCEKRTDLHLSRLGAPPAGQRVLKPQNTTVPRGKDKTGVFEKFEKSQGEFCQTGGGHLMTAHPGSKIIDVDAAIIPDLAFEPALWLGRPAREASRLPRRLE